MSAMRASFMILMHDDLPDSRHPAKRRAEPMAPRNAASVAGSMPSVASSIALSVSAAWATCLAAGDCESSSSRILSMRPSASDGFDSHDSVPRSHSDGPR